LKSLSVFDRDAFGDDQSIRRLDRSTNQAATGRAITFPRTSCIDNPPSRCVARRARPYNVEKAAIWLVDLPPIIGEDQDGGSGGGGGGGDGGGGGGDGSHVES